jgi:hypothetical protein
MTQTWRLDHSTVLDNDGNPVAIIADPAGDGNGERIEWPWVYDEALPESHVQAEANAVLIAAAPDMLAAFMDIQKHVDMSNTAYIRAWEIAEAAIANATGLNPCYDPFPSAPDLLRNSPAEEVKG